MYISVCLFPLQAFWRERGLCGTMITSGGESTHGASQGPLGVVEDACLHDDSPALVMFIGGKQQRDHAHMKVNGYSQLWF